MLTAMSAPASRPVTRKVARPLLVLAFLICGAALLAPLLTYPLGRDQAVFATAGRIIANGGVPYKDAWDMKPPGVFYLFWLSFTLFGPSESAPRLLDLFWSLATAAAIWALARRIFSEWAGVAAAFLFLLRYIGHDYYWHTTQCDGFASLPLALAALALVAAEEKKSVWWAGACGALVGFAVVFKFTLGIFLALPLVALIAAAGEPARRRAARAVFYLGGCAAVLAAVAGLIWKAGALQQMTEIIFVWNSQYARLQTPGLPGHNAVAELANLLVGSPNRLLFPIGLLALVGAADLCLRPTSGRNRWLVPAWAIAILAQVWIQGRYYSYHWLPALPPLALLAAQGLRTISRPLRAAASPRAARALSALGLAVLFGFLSFAHWNFLRWPLRHLAGRVPRATYLRGFDLHTQSDFSLTADRAVASWIRQHTPKDASIFIWGFEPLVYFLADRSPASRFLYNIPLAAPWSPPEWRVELVRDLHEKRPPYVLVVHNDAQPWMAGRWDDSASQLATYPELDTLLREGYRLRERIEDFDIFERRDHESPADDASDSGGAPGMKPQSPM